MFSHKLSTLTSFVNKKFAIVISDQIPSIEIAYTCSMIGFQFGRVIPQMVGRNQMIPGVNGSREHLGITTQNLPVLNGLDYKNMRALRQKLKGETDLFVTCLTDAVMNCANYDEYIDKVIQCPEDSTNYWGIGIFGDIKTVNQYTAGLKLYSKQPKTANPKIATSRLMGNKADLPAVNFIFPNDLAGGLLGNAAVVLGATLGKLYGDNLFGEPKDHAALSIGLPMINLSILNGHSATNQTMRKLRETLHTNTDSRLAVVDVTEATGKTRNYTDYLKIAESTPVLDTVYWGIGISGPKELVDSYTKDFSSYISAVEEQEKEIKSVTPESIKSGSLGNSESKGDPKLFVKKPTANMDDEMQDLFNKAKRSAAPPGKVIFTFSDFQLAKKFQTLLFEKNIRDFFDTNTPRNLKEVRVNSNDTAYEIIFVKDEYNWLVNNDKAFEKLLNASQKSSEPVTPSALGRRF